MLQGKIAREQGGELAVIQTERSSYVSYVPELDTRLRTYAQQDHSQVRLQMQPAARP